MSEETDNVDDLKDRAREAVADPADSEVLKKDGKVDQLVDELKDKVDAAADKVKDLVSRDRT